ncbi:hypothetical protein DEO72_LG10g1505 [Vigna unguiculata]|uniref:Uncharacterized protein n=1 Tax=Vigna unguiculata TaxID=3917 RepID=A0A4D6NEF4_VIGUN|nr:hypothetical protein DEO72_LG10g1505 [Vigna unguiculata]
MIFAELHEAAKVYLAKHAIDGVKDAADSYLSFHNTEVLLDYFELVVAAMDGSMHPNPFLIIHCQHWMKYCCCSSKVLCKSSAILGAFSLVCFVVVNEQSWKLLHLMIFAELHEAAKVYLAKHAIDGVKDAADSYLSFHNTEVLLDYFELVVAAMDGSMHPNPFLIIHCQHWMKYCCCSSKVLCKSSSIILGI